MNYFLITGTESGSYKFKSLTSEVIAAENPEAAGKKFDEKYSDLYITDVEEIILSNRSLAQAYTHKVTLKQDLVGEKKGTEYVLFDDGKVLDSEIMAFRTPPKAVALVVQNWQDFPMLVSAIENDKYHQHEYKDTTIRICVCGDIEEKK